MECNNLRKTKLHSMDEDHARPKDFQHNIVTTISSTRESQKNNCGKNKVTIETTVSWSKLPPLSPSNPVIEVISDGTTSTDAGSESSDDKENEKPENPINFPRYDVKSRLQRLGTMYSGSNEDTVIQRTEDKFSVEKPAAASEAMPDRSKPAGRSARLAALANTINQWEDDLRHFPTAKEAQGFSRSESKQRLIYDYEKPSPSNKAPSPVKMPSPEKPTSPEKPVLLRAPSPVKSSPVRATSPVKSLPVRSISPMKSAPFRATSPVKSSPVRATSPVKARYGSPIQMGTAVLKAKLKTVSSSDEEAPAPVMGVKQLRSGSQPRSPLRGGPVATTGAASSTRDPAELPLAERMALFERNAGRTVQPKAPLAMPVPTSKLMDKTTSTKHNVTFCKPSQQHSSGSLHDRLALFEKGPSENEVMKETSSVIQQELAMLRQRWNKNKEVVTSEKEDLKPSAPPPPPPLPSPPEPFEYHRTEHSGYDHYSGEAEEELPDVVYQKPTHREVSPVSREAKKVTFSPSSPGCQYPSEDDEDVDSAVQSEHENSDDNRFSISTSSKETDESSPEQEYTKRSKSSLKRDWSTSESSMGEVNEIDDLLEEALDISSDETSPPKRSLYSPNMRDESRSFGEFSSSGKERCESSNQPLLHTVSFYRKQQNMALKPVTPVRRVETNPSYLEESFRQTDDEVDMEMVKQKIGRLQQEVTKQETYISQASQALELCYSTFEFSGSTELLEAEKLLLLASQRRQALLQEIQRLKGEGRLYPGGHKATERGSLTITNVTLPLKMDVVHHAAKDDECYYLLCLVRHNEELLCSDIMSARRSLHSGNKITFPNRFTVSDLYNDFKVVVEVYAMKARHKELIPHDIKYHINTNKKEVSKLRLTPRKTKGDAKLVAQSHSSSVRSTAFTLAGYIILSLRDLHRTQFTLSRGKSTYNNVAEGSLQLRVESQMRVDVEHRGFLTMFEDVSGLGAWHRRWCLLKGDKLSYWKYPDDERKKIPLDTIELSQCSVREAEVVRRDVCARPNTLQLFTVRPARHTDTESLVLTRQGDRTCVRHWLSADTREERDQWCHHLNKALALMRAWGTSTAL